MPDADLILEGSGVKGPRHRTRADLIERGQTTARDFVRRWNAAHP